MGAADSKLSFKKGVFRLAEEKNIPADDPYWLQFWELPETAEDVFTLFSPADIRRAREMSLDNIETLILALTSRLFVLRHHPSFPDPDLAPEREALNCVRVLTRVLPFLYENDALEQWDEKFFWGTRNKRTQRSEVLFDEARGPDQQAPETPAQTNEETIKTKPLGEELIDTLVDLLFFAGFTLPLGSFTPKAKVTYAIWQSGVGCNTPTATSKETESNRIEVLRLLLAFSSKSLYMPSSILPTKGTRALTYLVTGSDKKITLSVLCSLLNTTLKYNPASWRVPYDHVVFSDPRQVLVTYSLHLLLVLLLYPPPEGQAGAPAPKNNYRHYLGRLHRTQDFQFLVDGMTRVLNQPIQASTSYLPGSQKSLKWAPEMIMLFWESLQCNKRFRSFLIDTDRAHDFVVLLLYYSLEYRNDTSKAGVVRMCVFVLQSLSAEDKFGKSLNKRFEGQNSLPSSVKIPSFVGSYADYLIISVYNLIATSKGKLGAIYPALLATIANVAPHVQNISAAASSKLVQLFVSLSAPAFMLANDTNHALLYSLLESINSIIEHQYSHNPNLMYAILRSHKRFESLREFTLERGQEEIEKQKRLQKDQAANISAPNSPLPQDEPRSATPPPEPSAFVIDDSEEEEDEDNDEKDGASASSAAKSPTQTTSRGGSIDESLPRQLRGMSEKARGKLPEGAFSRQNSALSTATLAGSQPSPGAPCQFIPTPEWIESWLPHLPLHTILTLIQELMPLMKGVLSRSNTTTSRSSSGDRGEENTEQQQQQQQQRNEGISMLERIRNAEIGGIEPSPIKTYTFEWSLLAIGWYESLLWGFIFVSEMHVGKGTVGLWNGTAIKLFRVQETAPEGPSLMAPRGAVDAVATNIVERLGNINISSLARRDSSTPQGGGNNNNAVTDSMRRPSRQDFQQDARSPTS